MSFPSNPVNGQTTTVNGILYNYNSSKQAWIRGTQAGTVASLASLTLTDATVSSSTTSGALVVTGGVGIGGSLNVGGSINAPAAAVTFSTVQATIGSITPNPGTFTTLTGTGKIALGTGTTTTNLVAQATTVSTSDTTGALVVRGGMGIAGRIYSTGVTTLMGNVVAGSGTQYTADNTGALVVVGDAYVSGNIITSNYNSFTNRVAVNFGTTPTYTANILINDPRATIGANVIGTITGYTTSSTTVFGNDELEMDGFFVHANVITTGTINFYISTWPGPVRGQRNLVYQIS